MYNKEKEVVTCVDKFTIEHLGRYKKIRLHCYDHVFDRIVTQEDVFNDIR